MDDQPVNYALQVQSPFQAAAQGYQLGAGIRNDQFQQQQQGLQLQQQQLGMQRAQAMNQAAYQVAQNPTPQSIAQLAIAFPEMSKQFKDANDMLAPAQQQARIAQATPVYAAMVSGHPDVASQLLTQQADAMENSGDAQGAQHARVMAQWAMTHPDSFKMSAGLGLSALMGPDKFADTFKTISPAGMQTAQAGADTATAKATVDTATVPDQIDAVRVSNDNLRSQIDQRTGQLALDRDKLYTDTQTKLHELDLQYGTPDAEGRKLVNEAATNGAAQEQSAARLDDLAGRIEAAGASHGVGGKTADIWNRAFGTENGATALKQELARAVTSTAVEQLRSQLGGGGRFTDTDMKVALSNVPDANSDPKFVASYLRGMAKLQNLAAAQENAKAEWLSQARHLGKAPRDISVMGTTVPAGTTFADFSRDFIQQKAAAMKAQQGLAAVQDRSYMRWAQPGSGADSGAVSQDAGGSAPASVGATQAVAAPAPSGAAIPPAPPQFIVSDGIRQGVSPAYMDWQRQYGDAYDYQQSTASNAASAAATASAMRAAALTRRDYKN